MPLTRSETILLSQAQDGDLMEIVEWFRPSETIIPGTLCQKYGDRCLIFIGKPKGASIPDICRNGGSLTNQITVRIIRGVPSCTQESDGQESREPHSDAPSSTQVRGFRAFMDPTMTNPGDWVVRPTRPASSIRSMSDTDLE